MIEHWDVDKDGELNETGMRKKLQDMGYSVHTYIYPTGTYFPDHSHAVDKIDCVLKGQFKLTMDGHSFVLGPGDCLAIPQGAIHKAEVMGDEDVISLDAIRI